MDPLKIALLSTTTSEILGYIIEKLLNYKKGDIEKLAKLLLEKETLDKEGLDEFFK